MSNFFHGKMFAKISELDESFGPYDSLNLTDEFVVVNDNITKKITGLNLTESIVSIGNLASKAYVDAVVDGAPELLNTLNEIAAALNDDSNFASNIINSIATKLPTASFGLEFWNALEGVTTFHIAEDTNLYYTQARFDTAIAAKTTADVAEGSNLYYTQARFDTALAAKTTSDVAEGSNLYWTLARFNAALATKTTSDLAEGDNLYFTEQRVLDIIASQSIHILDNGALAFGRGAGQVSSQREGAVAIGTESGIDTQGQFSVAVGAAAGRELQGAQAVAVGNGAGFIAQGSEAVAIGVHAGWTNQGESAVAIGVQAGEYTQSTRAVAIGYNAGTNTQGENAVAIGSYAGAGGQGEFAVAIGFAAGGNNQAPSTIILNATPVGVGGVTGQTNSFYVAPIRNAAGTSGVLQYNSSTSEVSYSNTITVDSNIWIFGTDGTLTLPAEPTSDGHAATKGYVDNQVDTVVAGQGFATLGYVEDAIGDALDNYKSDRLVSGSKEVILQSNGYIRLVNGAQLYDYGSGTGNGYGITDAANSTYIGYDPSDTLGALHMDSYTGGNIRIRTTTLPNTYKDWLFESNGALTLPAMPTSTNHAATKGYVDDAIDTAELDGGDF